MEGLHLHEGHINRFFHGEYTGLDCFEEEEPVVGNYGFPYSMIHGASNGQQMPHLHILPDKVLLLEVESKKKSTQSDPTSFQLLQSLQEEQLLQLLRQQVLLPPPSSLELDSCVTQADNAVAQEKKDKDGIKKRKRCRSLKKMEETESQRMNHIAVERNRRRLMNDHLSTLRSLMPPSYIQREDQATIVGGAIDYVKELEQHLQSLQAERHIRTLSKSDVPDSFKDCPFDGFFTSPQYTMHKPSCSSPSSSSSMMAEEEVDGGSTVVANIEVMVIQAHVNLRVLTLRRPGQLLRAIAAMEDLYLSVFHLNIASVHGTVLYSLNLKIEEECKLVSADEIATAVHQIFSHTSIDDTC